MKKSCGLKKHLFAVRLKCRIGIKPYIKVDSKKVAYLPPSLNIKVFLSRFYLMLISFPVV
ncbi:hypothetical protein M0P98_02445 [bacterium]|nr:hypothetical protein [bacterium]